MRVAVTIAFLAGILAAQTPEPDPKGAIRGVVRDSAGMPISGITVEAYRGGEPRVDRMGSAIVTYGSAASSAVTSDAGEYAITRLRPATYYVRTKRDPASSPYRPVKVEAEEVTLDIVVPAIPAISGHVLNPDGDLEVDAFVWLLKPEYESGVLKEVVIGPKITKEDGAYLFDSDLEPNRRYYLLVDRDVPQELKDREPIEVPTYYPSATGMDSAIPVVLQPGEHREKVDIGIATAPWYCVDGKIGGSGDFSIHESPLAGTRLARLRGSAGKDGKYRACGLSAGQYWLSAQKASTEFAVAGSDLQHVNLVADPGHLRIKMDWDDPSSAPEMPKLDAGEEATLRKVATLLGMGDAVSDDTLRGLAQRVSQFDAGDTKLEQALSDRMQGDGDFAREVGYLRGRLAMTNAMVNMVLTGAHVDRGLSVGAAVPSDFPIFDPIGPGDYWLEFQTIGKTVAYPKEVTYSGVKLAEGVLRIAPASAGTLHVVMAGDMGKIAVSVADIEDKPVPNATVLVVPDSVTSAPQLSRDSLHGMTDQNGSYTSPPLRPGKYHVLASTQTVRWVVPDDLEKVLLVSFQAKEVEVAPKATLQVAVGPVPIY